MLYICVNLLLCVGCFGCAALFLYPFDESFMAFIVLYSGCAVTVLKIEKNHTERWKYINKPVNNFSLVDLLGCRLFTVCSELWFFVYKLCMRLSCRLFLTVPVDIKASLITVLPHSFIHIHDHSFLNGLN